MPTDSKQKDIMRQLSEGIKELSSSQKWQEYLKFQSLFHNYSFSNVLLIATQFPSATRVAGYSNWKKMGRYVRKGEKAISILAPIIYKQDNANNYSLETETRNKLYGFKTVGVFDISQTEGTEVPLPCQNLIKGDYSLAYHDLIRTASQIGFQVVEDILPQGINGSCSHTEQLIKINCRNLSPQKVKTLAHEISHAILHPDFSDRALAELEAESVAYIICNFLGIDSSDYSFGYILSWAEGNENADKMIKGSGERIQKTSGYIIRALSTQKAALAA